jgi:hypothetical protein
VAFSGATYAQGINDAGQIVGYHTGIGFDDVSGTEGFLDTGGTYTTIAYTPASVTDARGINNSGEIVGTYYNPFSSSPIQGFQDIGGTFTTLDYPGAATTDVTGVNNVGQIVGWYLGSNLEVTNGFLDTRGTFTTIDYPTASVTMLNGINDSGEIVGFAQTQTPEPSTLLMIFPALLGIAASFAWKRSRASHG